MGALSTVGGADRMAETSGQETDSSSPTTQVDLDVVELSRGVDERKLVRKLDLHIIQLVMGL